MSFNPDISKQAHQVIFSRKRSIAFYPPLTFTNIQLAQENLYIYIYNIIIVLHRYIHIETNIF